MNKQRLSKACGWFAVIFGILTLVALLLAIAGGARIAPVAFSVCFILIYTGKHMIRHGFQRMR